MRDSRKNISFLGSRFVLGLALGLALVGGELRADPQLSAQLEKLRNSLAPSDPARQEIGLRLADSYFNDAVQQAKQAELSDTAGERTKGLTAARQTRVRALELYRESEKATKNDDLRVRIQFQQAQILDEMARSEEALPVWRQLAKQDLQPKIKTEALLKLAQSLESSSSAAARAEAEGYYKEALNFCREKDLCGFVHYRYGWLLRNRGEHARALAEIQQSLWDSRGSIQEEVLRDVLVFIVDIPGDGTSALAVVEPLSQKLGRPELLISLAENFFSAGNKAAGVTVLRLANDRSPSLGRQVRLLEEYYGARKWDEYRSTLVATEQRASGPYGADELQGDAEKILRRLVIQLDGERLSKKENLVEFSQTTLLYLKLFPGRDVAFRMMEGWLAAQSAPEERAKQIAIWLQEAAATNPQKLTQANIIALWETKASIAQKAGDQPALRAAMEALIPLYSSVDKKRESEYLLAKSYYETKEYDQALPRFQKLATVGSNGSADKYAVMSQNLALDVLNIQGNYAAIISQANSWLSDANLVKKADLKDEMAQIKEVAAQAKFESAAKGGDTKESLQTFLDFCLANQFQPKSCENAKNLAVRLKDQEALFTVLQKLGDKTQLVFEYEAAGFFGKAAELLEQEKPLAKATTWTPNDAIRIALLFELEGRIADRDRWLNAVIEKQRRRKSGGFELAEPLFLQTMLEANLLTTKDLSLPWSKDSLNRLAYHFEEKGQGTPGTRKILLDSKADLGPIWSAYVLEETQKLDQKQRKIDFYGKNGKAKFEKRLKDIQALDAYALVYLDGAGRETKIRLLVNLFHAYRDLSAAILATPLPEGLEPAVVEEIRGSLQQMADPFVTKADNFKRLTEEQIAKLDAGAQPAMLAMMNGPSEVLAASVAASAPVKPAAPSSAQWRRTEIQAWVKDLNANPDTEAALASLKEFFSTRNEHRLSSYFEGRIRNLKKGTL